MIDLYTGTPGSGKSLHIAGKIKSWIGHGYPVLGNFEIKPLSKGKFGGYAYIDNKELNVNFLRRFSEEYQKRRKRKKLKEDEILLIIDECQLIFNSRDWMKQDRSGWIWFFSQHRKLGYHVILACQFDMMIDKQIRALCEYEYLHRKVKNIGRGGALISLLAGGKLHVTVKIYRPLKEKVGSEFFKAKKSLYTLYDTYNLFGE